MLTMFLDAQLTALFTESRPGTAQALLEPGEPARYTPIVRWTRSTRQGVNMSAPTSLLMLEFLAWVASRHRTYSDVMNAWQSTCPRHTIWEDAMIDGYVQVQRSETRQDPEITLTPAGRALLNGRAGQV